MHSSTHYEEEDSLFVYSEDDICSSRVSDHNFYAVCNVRLVFFVICNEITCSVVCYSCYCRQMHRGQ